MGTKKIMLVGFRKDEKARFGQRSVLEAVVTKTPVANAKRPSQTKMILTTCAPAPLVVVCDARDALDAKRGTQQNLPA